MEVTLIGLAVLNIATAALGRSAAGGHSTALGIFFRFQVTDFDRFGFFSLCHFYFPSYLFGLFVLCCVGDTERQLTPAFNVLFWNEVVETNQFIFSALARFAP